MVHQRRTAIGPDLPIGLCRGLRPKAQDYATNQQVPLERGDVTHSRIKQEFPQVSPYVASIRSIRRPEIDQQQTGFVPGNRGPLCGAGRGRRVDPPRAQRGSKERHSTRDRGAGWSPESRHACLETGQAGQTADPKHAASRSDACGSSSGGLPDTALGEARWGSDKKDGNPGTYASRLRRYAIC